VSGQTVDVPPPSLPDTRSGHKRLVQVFGKRSVEPNRRFGRCGQV